MKLSRKLLPRIAAWLFVLACTTVPLLAADESAPDPADSPVGLVFRWLNFVLVAGALIYLVRKFLAPQFRSAAQVISQNIHEATEAQAVAERELQDVERSLASLDAEVQEMRRTAATESAAEAERLRTLAQRETEKIARAAQAEIQASERAGQQALRAIAARLATERAAELVRSRMTAGAEAELFRSFVGELRRTAR